MEQVLVEERQLDGVTDLLDLPAEAADVVVVDVGNLFEDEILDLGLGIRSNAYPAFVSTRRESPGRSLRVGDSASYATDSRSLSAYTVARGSASQTIRSSSA